MISKIILFIEIHVYMKCINEFQQKTMISLKLKENWSYVRLMVDNNVMHTMTTRYMNSIWQLIRYIIFHNFPYFLFL